MDTTYKGESPPDFKRNKLKRHSTFILGTWRFCRFNNPTTTTTTTPTPTSTTIPAPSPLQGKIVWSITFSNPCEWSENTCNCTAIPRCRSSRPHDLVVSGWSGWMLRVFSLTNEHNLVVWISWGTQSHRNFHKSWIHKSFLLSLVSFKDPGATHEGCPRNEGMMQTLPAGGSVIYMCFLCFSLVYLLCCCAGITYQYIYIYIGRKRSFL